MLDQGRIKGLWRADATRPPATAGPVLGAAGSLRSRRAAPGPAGSLGGPQAARRARSRGSLAQRWQVASSLGREIGLVV